MNPNAVGSSVTIYEDDRLCPLRLSFNISGTIDCTLNGSRMQCIPRYCLDVDRLQQLQKKMDKRVLIKMAVTDRVQAKEAPALGNVLREELASEVGEYDISSAFRQQIYFVS